MFSLLFAKQSFASVLNLVLKLVFNYEIPQRNKNFTYWSSFFKLGNLYLKNLIVTYSWNLESFNEFIFS